jgi:hypothetical protein
MEITRFNRHENMDSETRSRILDLISDLTIIENCNANRVINMLYGFFDGYDYSEHIVSDELLTQLTDGGNTYLVTEIMEVSAIVSAYPKLSYEQI